MSDRGQRGLDTVKILPRREVTDTGPRVTLVYEGTHLPWSLTIVTRIHTTPHTHESIGLEDKAG